MRYFRLTALVTAARLAAYFIAPIAVGAATADGRLPRWAWWLETHDRPGWAGPLSEGYPATRWGLLRWLLRNKVYALRWRYRALPDYGSTRWQTDGQSAPARWGPSRYAIAVTDGGGGRWWYRRWAFGFGLFVLYLNAGWKLQGFLEGARPGPNDNVSTGQFIGISLRSNDWDD